MDDIITRRKTYNTIFRLLNVFGLSIISFLIFYKMAKFLSKSMTADWMNFSVSKPISKKKFNVSDYWAGDLPEQALEILDIFNFSDVYERFSTAIPKGILLHGAPGTGKTHFARLLAALTEAEFFAASASQFDEVFVGKGAQRVRNLFEEARHATQFTLREYFMGKYMGKELPPKRAVIFIDELDAIGSRNVGLGGIHSSSHATVSQLLTCLDGLDDRGNVFVIAATNNLSQIDPAIRRSGRFDRVIEMPLPNEHSRLNILSFYLKNTPGVDKLSNEGVLKKFAKKSEGFSSADIKNLANESVMQAVKKVIKEKRKSNETGGANLSAEDGNPSLKSEHLEAAYQIILTKLKKEKSVMFMKTTPNTDNKLDKLD